MSQGEGRREYNRIYQRKWREKNREKLRAYNREYQRNYKKANRPYAREMERKWKERHPEKAKAKAKRINARYNATEKARVVRDRYAKSPKGLMTSRAKTARRRAAGYVSRTMLEAMFREFSSRCAYCARRRKLHAEHVVPVASGGLTVLKNLVPACATCNRLKGVQPWRAWFRAQSFHSVERENRIARRLR